MTRYASTLLLLTLFHGAALGFAAQDRAAPPSAADYLPKNLLFVATLRDGDQQLQAFRKLLNERQILESETVQNALSNPGFLQAQIGLAGLAATANLDAWSALGAFLGRELVIGAVPSENGPPRFIAVVVARQPDAVDRLLEGIHALTGLVRGGEPDETRSRVVDGVRVYAVNENFLHCRVDDALIASNSRELLQAALAGRGTKETLSNAPAYRRAARAVPKDAAAWAYADMTAIRTALGPDRELPEQIPNPLVGFLFGGWWHTLRNADAAVAWISAKGGDLQIDARLKSKTPLPASHEGYALKKPVLARWSADDLPRFIAEFSVARNWGELFSERESLLTLPAAGQVVNFMNTLTTLMGPVDFVVDVLANVSGPVRLILARQEFSKSPFEPTPKLPAFALVTPLRFDAQSNFSRRLYSAAQTALSVINLDNAQKNQPTFFIEPDRYNGHRIIFSEFADPPATDNMEMDAPEKPDAEEQEEADPDPEAEQTMAGIRYNFAPAAAVVSNQFVIATSLDLLRDVIDAIDEAGKNARGAKRSPNDGPAPDTLSIRVSEVVAALRENRRELVVNNMLEKDHSKQAAEREIDTLLGLLDFFEAVEISSRLAEKGLSATARISLRAPSPN